MGSACLPRVVPNEFGPCERGVQDVARIYFRDRDEVERLLPIPQLSMAWKAWAERLLAKAKA